MAKCININHPDFKKLASESGIHPAILAAQMGVWMEKNNTDEWPKLEQLNVVSGLATVFERKFENELLKEPFNYDFKTNYYKLFNSSEEGYIKSKKEILIDIKKFIEARI